MHEMFELPEISRRKARAPAVVSVGGVVPGSTECGVVRLKSLMIKRRRKVGGSNPQQPFSRTRAEAKLAKWQVSVNPCFPAFHRPWT